MMVKAGIVLILTGVFLSACSSESNKKEERKIGFGAQCEFAGSWSRCDQYGSSSTRIDLAVAGSEIAETIRNYDSDGACQGEPDSSLSFTAHHVLGERGRSESAPGGTDVEMSDLSIDLFGCGSQPVYTVIKLNEGCTEFLSASSSPSCEIENRGTDFDPRPFLRQ